MKRDDLRDIRESGFSLLETMFALIIIMIALLGTFSVFTYAINYNAGNRARSQSLGVLQQEAEQIRSAKFNSSTTDAILMGGVRAERVITAQNGRVFKVNMTVDDDPLTAGTQIEASTPCRSPQGAEIVCAFKEITINVELAAPSTGWMANLPPVTLVLRRVRGN